MKSKKSRVNAPRAGALPKIPPRRRDAHKGDFGHVLVVAGSRRMTGAACLTAVAALRSGAGLVTLAVPESIHSIVASRMTSVMTLPCRETAEASFAESAADEILTFAEKCDAVAIGPGIGKNPETAAMVRRIFSTLAKPLVVDAEGLYALAEDPEVIDKFPAARPTVLTPHPGEMSRLCLCSTHKIQADRTRCAATFTGDHRITLVLKGAGTVVAEGAKSFVCKTGNPGMATGGAGDVLTGMIAALLGQKFPAFDAAQLAAYIHGMAGDIAAGLYGEISMIADDVLDCLPAAFKKFTARGK